LTVSDPPSTTGIEADLDEGFAFVRGILLLDGSGVAIVVGHHGHRNLQRLRQLQKAQEGRAD